MFTLLPRSRVSSIKAKLIVLGVSITVLVAGTFVYQLLASEGLQQEIEAVAEIANTNVNQAQTTAQMIGARGAEMHALSRSMQANSLSLGRANLSVRVVERKLSGVAADIRVFNNQLTDLLINLPDGETKLLLEELADEMAAVTDALDREARVHLDVAAESVDLAAANIAHGVNKNDTVVSAFATGLAAVEDAVGANTKILGNLDGFQANLDQGHALLNGVMFLVAIE